MVRARAVAVNHPTQLGRIAQVTHHDQASCTTASWLLGIPLPSTSPAVSVDGDPRVFPACSESPSRRVSRSEEIVDDIKLAALREAVDLLASREHESLVQRFGTVEEFVDGYAYHNATHAHDDVRVAAGRIAGALAEARVVGSETVPLAEYAGVLHDTIQDQGPGANERLSAEKAAAAMRARGLPEPYVAVVMKMIAGTEVVRIKGNRIVQAAD